MLAEGGGGGDADAEAKAGGFDREDVGGGAGLMEPDGLRAVEMLAENFGFEGGAGLSAHGIDGGRDRESVRHGIGSQGAAEGQRKKEKFLHFAVNVITTSWRRLCS